MSKFSDFTAIIVVCGLILVIMLFRNKLEKIARLFLRGVVGMALIFCVNQVLLYCGIVECVGMNLLTFLTCVVLGIPGVCALYFIVFI